MVKHQKTEKCQNVKFFYILTDNNNKYQIEINKQKEIINGVLSTHTDLIIL
jgi:hypothetical protein